ncbi:MAG: tRNA (adenosine(37)-N6)-threonylcarbamoyltransferase complex ATPase subunit type 1 TsaE [Oligoflexia bacterium]|nr:tRNA (adenosine(37)-N6)-threonylcarbamoyltransferase complex ATPase subunit type 1 TsaE [Oligoflexia bacterium]
MKSNSVAKTHQHAAGLARKIKKFPALILLKGELGVGKSEWVRGFIRAKLKKQNLVVTSPSYSLIQAYGSKKNPIYHCDLYRLRSVDDLESTGFWDLMIPGAIVLAEWGDMIQTSWPKNIKVIEIHIKNLGGDQREITETELSGLSD